MRFCLQADGNGLKRMPCRQSPIRVCFVIAYKKKKKKKPTRAWDGTKTSLSLQTYFCKDGGYQSRGMLAHRSLRWMQNIPNVPSVDFSFFL